MKRRLSIVLALLPVVGLWGCGADTTTSPDTTAPLAPQLDGATLDQGLVGVWWQPNSEPDLAGYVIYRSGPEKKFERISDTLVTTASFIDSSVLKSQTYFYRIKAVDQKGNVSDFSEEVSEKVE